MITRATLSTIEQGLPKYRSMLAGNPAFSPFAFESIASATATGSASSITFSSIPATYQHLELRIFGRSTSAGANHSIRVNNISSSTYTSSYFLSYGVSNLFRSGNADTRTYIAGFNFGDSPNYPTATVVNILDYANTNKKKVINSYGGYSAGGQGEISITSGAVTGTTAAISEISIFTNSGNWASGSTFALYGIKGS